MHHASRSLLLAVFLLTLPSISSASGLGSLSESSHQHLVEHQFAMFSESWIDKIDRNFTSRIGNLTFEKSGEAFIGRFMQVDRDSVSWTVKQTTGPTPSYIGLLMYTEWTYESMASTRADAARGPFVPVNGRKVTEIFQYSVNRWLD